MKKMLSFIMLTLVSLTLFAQAEALVIKKPNIDKKKCWDKTLIWISTTMDKYEARINYQNYDSGTIIVKGEFVDKDNSLFAVDYGFVKPIVEYTLTITCRDGFYEAKYSNMTYRFRSGRGDYSMSTLLLEWIKQELEEIAHVSNVKGDVWSVDDDYFKERHDELQNEVDEAEKLKDDETLKKKERKKFKRFYEANHRRPSVYYSVYRAGRYGLPFQSIYGSFDGKQLGLKEMVESTL